jgi:hypothetical protein
MVIPIESEIEHKEYSHGSKNWANEDFKSKNKLRETGGVETHERLESKPSKKFLTAEF